MTLIHKRILLSSVVFYVFSFNASAANELSYDCSLPHASACITKTFGKQQNQACTDNKSKIDIDALSEKYHQGLIDEQLAKLKDPKTNGADAKKAFDVLGQLKSESGPTVGKRKEWSETSIKEVMACLGANAALVANSVPLEKSEINHAEHVWATQFLVGYMQQSEYETDEEGNSVSKGLQQGGALVQLGFNGRWLYEGDNDKMGLYSADLGVVLSQSGVCDPNKANATTDTDPASTQMKQMTDTVNCNAVKFNDVADSIDVYAKLLLSPAGWQSSNYDSILSFGPMVGFKSRDALSVNGDSVNGYYGVSVDYNVYGKNIMHFGNSNPRAKLSLAALRFEEYSKPDKDEWRYVIIGSYQLVEDNDFTIGFRANLGSGTDDFGVFIGYKKTGKQLMDFF